MESPKTSNGMTPRQLFTTIVAALLVAAVIIFAAWSLFGGKSNNSSSISGQSQGQGIVAQQQQPTPANNPAPVSDDYPGKYWLTNVPGYEDNYLELLDNGKVLVGEGSSISYSGTYTIKGDELYITFDNAPNDGKPCSIKHNVIVDSNGKKYVKRMP